MSICLGLDEIIDRHLDITDVGTSPHYKRTTSCQRLSQRPLKAFRATALLEEMLARLQANWKAARSESQRTPSAKNWRWSKQLWIRIDPANPSAEKTLEKAIARLTGNEWVNQIPTASGLHGPMSDRQRNVDLGHRIKAGHYELIELKVASNTPLLALVEVLHAVVLYVHARIHYPSDLQAEHDLLHAETIDWRVLAPANYYSMYSLEWLEQDIDSGLRTFGRRHLDGLPMGFAFTAFPAGFHWPSEEQEVLAALEGIAPVDWGPPA